MLENPAPESSVDIGELKPIVRYIGILATKYPKPMSNKELASYAHVSEPAVSKLKDRLYSLCDDRWLGHRRRLILRTDNETASQIFAVSFLSGKLPLLLKSPYGRAMIDKWTRDSFRKVVKGAPGIRIFFTEEDATFLAGYFTSAIADSMKQLNFETVFDSSDDLGVQYAFVGLVYTVWTKMGPCLQRSVKDEAILHRLLVIRDKTWFLLLEVIEKRLESILRDFLQQLPNDQARKTYLSMQRQTAAFYLERAISKFITEPLRNTASKRKLEFDEDFINLGRFYTPFAGSDTNPQKSSSTNSGGRESET